MSYIGVGGEEEDYLEDSHFDEIPGEHWEEPSQGGEHQNDIALTKEMIRHGLSRIARTLDTFEFAYSRFDCRNKDLSNVDILGKYIHLRIIDLGENKLKSCQAIAPVQDLLMLNVESNLIESFAEIPDYPFLQALCLRNNKLTSTDGLFANCLSYLQLGDNAIEDIYGLTSDLCPWLTVLELKGNKIRTLEGIDLPQLQRIYLAQNELKDLVGLDGCPSLTHLHARDNKIAVLEKFPALEKLEYVNLRGNQLKRFTQVVFLGNAPNIKTLVLKDNPIATLSNYKIELLTANPNVRRLDKSPVLETEMMEARQVRIGREQGNRPSLADDDGLAGNSASALELEALGSPKALSATDDWSDAAHDN